MGQNVKKSIEFTAESFQKGSVSYVLYLWKGHRDNNTEVVTK